MTYFVAPCSDIGYSGTLFALKKILQELLTVKKEMTCREPEMDESLWNFINSDIQRQIFICQLFSFKTPHLVRHMQGDGGWT